MTEDEIRRELDHIDDKRKRAATFDKVARWPMGVPSEVQADKRRGIFRSIWKGTGTTVFAEVTLTNEERSAMREYMELRARQLRAEAETLAKHLAEGTR